MDGISLAPPPKCVSTIHLSSDLWRHFDRGLHLWLVKYYYKPILSLGSNILVKIFAMSICFSIVAVWHALSGDVIVWCMLNFCAVAIELTGINVRRLFFNNFETQLSTKAIKRWKSLIAAPFYIIMIITNTFFLANTQIGLHLFKKVLFSFPSSSSCFNNRIHSLSCVYRIERILI
ncbi:protein-cysteine N-palmitoyltransferase HHAT-like [Panonychus citri]|uniref:protein-cysteine N-palmitoyltransferase HHAT-like n=1 Tax=Panonychus citri TaxID=50023 RepID=UPI002307494D|nr:protein-cysteine N-palmitoyltransferase HHAT-like [Panonychus citri]